MTRDTLEIEKDLIEPIGAAKLSSLPLVIGVTGHRDLIDSTKDYLKNRVAEIIADLKRLAPNTQIVLLSALAEGADRLVAEVALDNGIHLVVPLPLERGDYMRDFATEESREEFNRLLGQAKHHFYVGEAQIADGSKLTAEDKRSHQYALCGAYIALHSQVLIALWDGEDGALGGTSQVVKYELLGVPPPYVARRPLLDPLETGMVKHVVTPRISKRDIADALTVKTLYHSGFTSESQASLFYEQIFRSLNDFNVDAGRHVKDPDLETSASYLRGAAGKKVPETARALVDYYAIADTLAIHFKRAWDKSILATFIAAFLGVLCFAVFAHYIPYPPVLILYPVFLLAALSIALVVKRSRAERKYLEYRALAEGIRVQFFWLVAGLPEAAAEHYLRKQRTELDWIRNALRSAMVFAAPAPDPDLAFLKERWIDDQGAFFKRAMHRDQKLDQQLANVVGLQVALATLAIVCLTFLDWHVVREVHAISQLFSPQVTERLESAAQPLHRYLILAVGVFTAGAGFVLGYSKTKAIKEQVRQYERMSSIFELACNKFESFACLLNVEMAHVLIRELGEEALNENADWVILHLARPIEMPIGG
jgi:hypothetical protein